MRRAPFVIAAVSLSILALAACGRVAPRSYTLADYRAGASPIDGPPKQVDRTPATVPPPPSHQAPLRASRSAGTRPQVAQGGGPCDRPSTCPQLRQCENGGSYAHGTSPQFDGAYQFADRSAWGMTPKQQDDHADQMYAERGAQPWPVCGKYLRG